MTYTEDDLIEQPTIKLFDKLLWKTFNFGNTTFSGFFTASLQKLMADIIKIKNSDEVVV